MLIRLCCRCQVAASASSTLIQGSGRLRPTYGARSMMVATQTCAPPSQGNCRREAGSAGTGSWVLITPREFHFLYAFLEYRADKSDEGFGPSKIAQKSGCGIT